MFGSPWRYAALALIATIILIIVPLTGSPRWLNVLIWIAGLPLAIWSVRRMFGILDWRTPYGDDDNDHLYPRHHHLRRPVRSSNPREER